MQDLSPAGLFELSFFMQVIIKYSRASIVLWSPHLNPGFYHHTAFKGLIRKGRSGEVQYLLRFRVGPDLSLRFFPSTAQGLIHSLPGHLAGSDPIYLLPGCSSGRTERTEIKRGGGDQGTAAASRVTSASPGNEEPSPAKGFGLPR